MADKQRSTNRTITENRKAFHDYFIEESLEAGIELCGTEVKALRRGGVNLKDAWCSVVEGEMFINGMHISPYEQGNIFNLDPLRVRRLLLHKREIKRICAGAAVGLFQGRPGEGASGTMPRQKAV